MAQGSIKHSSKNQALDNERLAGQQRGGWDAAC